MKRAIQLRHKIQSRYWTLWKSPVAVSILISSLIVTVMVLFDWIRWEGADDFTISQILMGSAGTPSPMALTINYLLGVLVCALQSVFPYLNWLTVLEILSVWASFTVFQYVIIGNLKCAFHGILSIVFVCALEVQFLLTLTYTRSAFILTFAGMLLIADTLVRDMRKNRHRRVQRYYNAKIAIKVILGIVLFGFGCMFRGKCGYASIAYASIVCIFPGIKALIKGKKRNALRLIDRSFQIVICIACVSLLVSLVHLLAYDRWNQTNDYSKINKLRSSVYDYSPSQYPIEWAGREMGFSENDYNMMKYMIWDDKAFNTDFFLNVKDALDQRESVNVSQSNDVLSIIERTVQSVTRYAQGRYRGTNSLYAMVLTLFILCLILAESQYYPEVIACFTGTVVFAVYFVSHGRFPPWVMDSIYLEASIILIYTIAESNAITDFRRNKLLSLCIVVVCMIICIQPITAKAKGWKKRTNSDIEALFQYAESQDGFFLLDGALDTYVFVDLHSPLYGFLKGEWSNIMRAGNWDTGHPVREAQKKAQGIDSLLLALAEGKARLITKSTSDLNFYKRFFKEHYGINIKARNEYKARSIGIYKFYVEK